jgi:hypothetical protein
VFVPIQQTFPHRGIEDVADAVRAELEASGFGKTARPGARIAIGAVSRGVADIAVMVRAAFDFWKSHNCEPFVVPAMGSHGAGTPEGQASVLAYYGIDERRMDCPVVSAFDVVPLGRTNRGMSSRILFGPPGTGRPST